MREFLCGALVMGSAVAGLFFLRFWRRTHERLFFYFALSFWILGVNWAFIPFAKHDEPQTALYSLRLLAFGLIIAAILDKNRQKSV